MSRSRPHSTDLVLAVGLVICWSSGFVGARLGTEDASATTLLAWRLLVSGTLAIGWLAWRRDRLSTQFVTAHAGLGLLTQVGFLGGVVGGVGAGVPAGTTALIAALQPIVVAVAAAPLLHEPMRVRHAASLAIGLGGVGLVVAGDLGTAAVPIWVYLVPVAGMLSLSAGTVFNRRAPSTTSVMDAVAVHTVVAAGCFIGLAASTDQLQPPTESRFYLAVVWVVVLSTIGGYGCYLGVLRRVGPTRTSTLLYLTPPVTMLWAYAMFGDPIGVRTWGGLALCAIAVAGMLIDRPASGRSNHEAVQPSAGSSSTSRSGVRVSASG